MNVNEAKELLLAYRPGTSDGEDPQIAEALALACKDADLARWLEEEKAQQAVLRVKFGQIPVPTGLKEQIISEYAAGKRPLPTRRILALATVAVCLLLGAFAVIWPPHRKSTPDNILANYQDRMVRIAQDGYSMDLLTNNLISIRGYFAANHAPSDVKLPEQLSHAALTGCAVRVWDGAKVSLICFRTGKPLPPNVQSDLWLFVVDRAALKDAPTTTVPQLAKVSQLITATWANGDKLYFLGIEGEEPAIRQYL